MASARFESSEEVSESSDHQEDSEVDLATIQVRKERTRIRLIAPPPPPPPPPQYS